MPDDGRAMTEPRTTTHDTPLPLLRAAVFAVVGTVLGVSAHHLVADGPVPWRQSTTAMAVLFVSALTGTQRPRSPAAVVAVCGAAQAGLHFWLMAEHSAGSHPMARVMPAHMHHATGAHGAWHERLHDSSAMTVAHALAAVLAAVLLHRADSVCWSLARGFTVALHAVRVRIATARAVLNAHPAPTPSDATTPPHAASVRRPSHGTRLADVVVRRGPPRAGLTLTN